MGNELANSVMWDSAVTDHDAAEHRGLVVRAKVALTGTWPFLAAASSNEEFEHKLALVQEQIERSTPPEILGEITASLREDFQTLLADRLNQESTLRTAARTIVAAEGEQSLPQAYVHVHKHAADGDEYYQIDHVAGPTFLQTVGRKGDRDEAMQTARQFGLPNGLPIYENGRYVEGRRLTAGQEYFDAKLGRWVKQADFTHMVQVQRPGMEPHREFHTSEADANAYADAHRGNGAQVDVVKRDGMNAHMFASLRTTAHQSWAPGGNALHPAAGIADEAGRARRAANWGDSLNPVQAKGKEVTVNSGHGRGPVTCSCGKTVFHNGGGATKCPQCGDHTPGHKQATNYQPDPSAGWRYHSYPQPPFVPAQGGQPTAPTIGPTITDGIGNTSIDSDGFPVDLAQGEYNAAAQRMQFQLTPGQWVVTPGSEWPVRPNAADPTQVPRTAGANWDSPGDAARQAHARGEHDRMRSLVCPDCHDNANASPEAREHSMHSLAPFGSSRRQASTDDFYTYNSQAGPFGNTGEGGNDLIDELLAKGSEHKRNGMDQRQHSDVYNELRGRYGHDAAEAYRYGYQTSHLSSRRVRAQEGIAPTPGPNPNYFSQGTQGLQGPAEFPQNPSSAIEPKTDNRMDDFYGTGTPPVSPGSSQGQVDGAGYSRQGARKKAAPPFMSLERRTLNFDDGQVSGYDVHMHHEGHPDGPDAEHFHVGWWPTKERAVEQGNQYGETYRRGWGLKDAPTVHVPQVARRSQGSRLGFSRSAGERISGIDWDRTDAPDPRAEAEQAEYDRNVARRPRNPNEPDPWGEAWDAAGNPLGEVGRRRQAASNYDRDREEGVDHGRAGQDLLAHYSRPTQGYIDGHEQGTQERAGMHPDDQAYWARQASTDGRIVGKCDHCGEPVRYHTEHGGHLRHLHNSSPLCADGKQSTAMRMTGGGVEYRFRAQGAVLENPSADNPSGRGGDPYRAKTTWEGFEQQRKRQPLDGEGGMNANTPTTAPDPIPTGGSNPGNPGNQLDDNGPRERGDQDEDDDDD